MTKIEELLPVNPLFEPGYKNTIEIGKANLRGKKIVFSMLTRNSELTLRKNIETLINLVDGYVEDYRFVIYENDSTDDTKNILKQISEENPFKIIFKTETHNRKFFGQTKDIERTEALAEYRNINLSYIKNNLIDYDYVVVCDSDFLDISLNGFYHSIGILSTASISAICGNSFQLKIMNSGIKLWNYDSWAYRGTWWQDLNFYKNQYIDDHMLWFGLWMPPIGSIPIIVNSAFGGMAIYKRDVYVQGVYQGLDCEHVLFHWDLSAKVKDFNLALNPSQIMLMK